METVADRLRISREKTKLTKKEFASKHEFEYGAYLSHENNTRNPPDAVLEKYAAALGVDFLWLKFGSSWEDMVKALHPKNFALRDRPNPYEHEILEKSAGAVTPAAAAHIFMANHHEALQSLEDEAHAIVLRLLRETYAGAPPEKKSGQK